MPPAIPFRPARFLANPHVQTCWGRLVRSRRSVAFSREALATPDGDELLLDHAEPAAPPGPDRPRAVLLHGLEGSSNSVYVQGLATLLLARGLAVTALNFRSCARDPRDGRTMLPNRRPRLYHSGETEDMDLVFRTLVSREPARPLVAIGVSLGGNALLKWCGEHRGEGLLARVATLSVPYDLAAGSAFMERGLGPFYVGIFLKTLRPKGLDLVARFPEETRGLDPARIRAAKTFREIDDAATGPLHGFRDVDDYYARSSSLGFLPRVDVPALCLSAEDDPFLPREALDRARAAASPAVTLLTTPRGGHVGFVGGTARAPAYWGEERAAAFAADGT